MAPSPILANYYNTPRSGRFTTPDRPPSTDDLKKLEARARASLSIENNYTMFATSSRFDTYECAIGSIIKSYITTTKTTPHVICGSMEPSDQSALLDFYASNKIIELSRAKCNIYGSTTSNEIKKLIKSNTCLVVCSFVNDQLGSINNMKIIGATAHKHKIMVFCDASFLLGKYPVAPKKNNIDAVGVELSLAGRSYNFLFVRTELIKGYKLLRYDPKFNISDRIFKTISRAECIAISDYFTTTRRTDADRRNRNEKLVSRRDQFIKNLSARLNVKYYSDIITKAIEDHTTPNTTTTPDIILLSPPDDKLTVPFVVSFIAPNDKSNKLRTKLEKKYALYKPNNEQLKCIGICPEWCDRAITIYFSDNLSRKDVQILVKEISTILV